MSRDEDLPEPAVAVFEQTKSASPNRRDPRFSRLNPKSGSEVFTKFANVKSRINWTAERRQQLQEMWDRNDKAPVIAAALGCKVGAINRRTGWRAHLPAWSLRCRFGFLSCARRQPRQCGLGVDAEQDAY